VAGACRAQAIAAVILAGFCGAGSRSARGATGSDQISQRKEVACATDVPRCPAWACRSIDGRSAGVAQALNVRRRATI